MGRRKEKKLEKQQAKLDKMQKKLDRKSGKKNSRSQEAQTQASVPEKKVDLRDNPLYPDRIESDAAGVLIAIGSMVVALILLVLIVTNFSYAITGGSYVADVTTDSNDTVEDAVETENDLQTDDSDVEDTEEMIDSDVEDTEETVDSDVEDIEEADVSDAAEVEEEETVSEEGIHSYELIISDVTWQGAFDDCIARGGHLVRINSREEWDFLISMLDAQKGDVCYFYIAGSRAADDLNYYWQNEEGMRYGDALNDSSFWGSDLWLEGEPSFADEDTEETNLAILYRKSANQYVLNDISGETLNTEEYLAGKIAYICEYD